MESDKHRIDLGRQRLLETGLGGFLATDRAMTFPADWVLSRSNFEHLLHRQFDTEVAPAFASIQRERVVTPWWSTGIPFDIADDGLAGVVEDLRSYNPRLGDHPLADSSAGRYLPHLAKHLPILKFVADEFLPCITRTYSDMPSSDYVDHGPVRSVVERRLDQAAGPSRFDATFMAIDLPTYQRSLATYFAVLDGLFRVHNPTPLQDQFTEQHGPWAGTTSDVWTDGDSLGSSDPVGYLPPALGAVIERVGIDMLVLREECRALARDPGLAFRPVDEEEYGRDREELTRRVDNFRVSRGDRLTRGRPPASGFLRQASLDRSPGRNFATLGEIEKEAQERLSAEAYSYIVGGAGGNETRDRNRDAFSRVVMRPQYFTGIRDVDPSSTLLGLHLANPVGASPIGADVLFHPDGARAIAAGVAAEGGLAIVSEAAGWSLESVAAFSTGPKLMQFHAIGELADAVGFANRAAQAGYMALCVTVDCPTLGWREANRIRRFDIPTDAFSANHPNSDFVGALTTGRGSPWTWDTLEKLVVESPIPIVAKGILTASDAKKAFSAGVAAIIVSNHGGRQIDGVASTLDALISIREALGWGVEIAIDGGVRTGSDVVKSYAMGANYVFMGRPLAFGLAANGVAGVREVLRLVREEVANQMVILGRPSTASLHGTGATLCRIHRCGCRDTSGLGDRAEPSILEQERSGGDAVTLY